MSEPWNNLEYQIRLNAIKDPSAPNVGETFWISRNFQFSKFVVFVFFPDKLQALIIWHLPLFTDILIFLMDLFINNN